MMTAPPPHDDRKGHHYYIRLAYKCIFDVISMLFLSCQQRKGRSKNLRSLRWRLNVFIIYVSAP